MIDDAAARVRRRNREYQRTRRQWQREQRAAAAAESVKVDRPLTPQQARVFDFLVRAGAPATLREISAAVPGGGNSGTLARVRALQKRGLVRYVPGKHRTIRAASRSYG